MGKLGAMRGVPGMKRRGHPVTTNAKPPKKPVVAKAPMATPLAGLASPLAALTKGAAGRGTGFAAVPQGASPAGYKKGGRCK